MVLLILALSTAGPAPEVDFNRDVRPLLAQHCFACHGMDDHARKGKLRLDLSEAAYGAGKSGQRAIVPGKPEESEIIRRIFSDDPDEADAAPAHQESHLRIRKVRSQDLDRERRKVSGALGLQPAPANGTAPGDLHPIDAFVQDRLTKEGLKPSPEANRYALVRRVYLDLIGLPPTPAEADAFVRDTSPNAYETLVDSLLASQPYGERWARRWLDLARYADTNGFEKDRPRNIWPYRDWVVRALNDDMPFDQFSIRQLAGDMLPNPSPEDLIATGFHRNTMLNEEGGIDPNEYRFYAMVDRVAVTGTTWMGLTLNCSQCHTHKYDPILHTDYYSVMALLNNADEPAYAIPTEAIEARQKAQAETIARMEAELPAKFPGGPEALKPRFEEWLTAERRRSSHWEILRPETMQTTMPHLERQPDGFILGSGDISKSDVYDLTFRAPIKDARAIRIEVTSHPSLPNDGPGLTNYEGPIGGFFLSELQASQNGQTLKFANAEATNEEEPDRISDAAASPAKSQAAAAKPKKAKKTNTARSALDGEMSSGWQVLGGYGVAACRGLPFRGTGGPEQRLRAEDAVREAFRLSVGPLPHFRDHKRSCHRHRSSRGCGGSPRLRETSRNGIGSCASFSKPPRK